MMKDSPPCSRKDRIRRGGMQREDGMEEMKGTEARGGLTISDGDHMGEGGGRG